MSSETLVKRREPTPDLLDAADPDAGESVEIKEVWSVSHREHLHLRAQPSLRSKCKQCGGSGMCEYIRKRSTCKECNGSSICEQNRQKSRRKHCGGSGICEHNRQRSGCKSMRRGEHLRAQPPKNQAQAMRRVGHHLRAQQPKEQV